MRNLGTEPIKECPCCKFDDWFQKDACYEGDDTFIITWVCNRCRAEWVEEYHLVGSLLIQEGVINDQS